MVRIPYIAHPFGFAQKQIADSLLGFRQGFFCYPQFNTDIPIGKILHVATRYFFINIVIRQGVHHQSD